MANSAYTIDFDGLAAPDFGLPSVAVSTSVATPVSSPSAASGLTASHVAPVPHAIPPNRVTGITAYDRKLYSPTVSQMIPYPPVQDAITARYYSTAFNPTFNFGPNDKKIGQDIIAERKKQEEERRRKEQAEYSGIFGDGISYFNGSEPQDVKKLITQVATDGQATGSEGSDDYTEYAKTLAPILNEAIFGKDARERLAMTRARIENLKQVKKKAPKFFHIIIDNRIRTLKATIPALEEQVNVKRKSEGSVDIWNVMGQTGLSVGIALGIALIGLSTYYVMKKTKDD